MSKTTRKNKKDNKNIKKSRGARIADIILTTVGVLLLLITSVFVITKFITPGNFVFGTRYDVVLTDSMSKIYEGQKDQYEQKGWTNQIQVHDLIVTKEITEDTEINIGDIVTYKNPLFGLTTHRVVGKVADQYGRIKYVIQADATNVIDGEFYRSYIVGVVTKNVGQIGQVVYFLQSIYGTIMLVGLAMICFLYSFLSDYTKKKKEVTGDVIDVPVIEKETKKDEKDN